MMAPETVVTIDGSQQAGNKGPAHQDAALGWLKINVDYFKTIPGIIKLVQLLFGIIAMACASPALVGGTHWFLFVVVVAFIATLCWCFVYFLGIREALKLPVNWIMTEFLNTAILTILYFIAFIVQLSVWSSFASNRYRASNLTAGCFGLFNTLAYAAGTYYLYMETKSGAATSS